MGTKRMRKTLKFMFVLNKEDLENERKTRNI